MTIQQEIFKVVDALLKGRTTQEEVLLKAKTLGKKVNGPQDDPPSALTTILLAFEPDPFVKFPETENWKKELLLAREVLKRGVPFPDDEQWEKLDAFMLRYKVGGNVVLCQIKKNEKGERVLEFIEESWEGERIYYEQVPIPLKKSKLSPSEEDIEEKENAYKNQNLTREKALQWVVGQLQRKGTFKTYGKLLRFYWILLRPDQFYGTDYVHYGKGGHIDKW